MRVIVCGSRRWSDRGAISNRLADLVCDHPGEEITIVHGAAAGADRIAAQEALKGGLFVEAYPYREFVHDGVSPKRAPLVRNSYMAEQGADLCIAFWDGRSTGTADMMEKARQAGIPLEVLTPTASEES